MRIELCDLFDTKLTKHPPAPRQTIVCCQTRVHGEVEETSCVQLLKNTAFYRKVLKSGGYANTLVDFDVIEE